MIYVNLKKTLLVCSLVKDWSFWIWRQLLVVESREVLVLYHLAFLLQAVVWCWVATSVDHDIWASQDVACAVENAETSAHCDSEYQWDEGIVSSQLTDNIRLEKFFFFPV